MQWKRNQVIYMQLEHEVADVATAFTYLEDVQLLEYK